MNTKQSFLAAAGLMALGLASVTANAMEAPAGTEKCYGVAKVGANDCASADGAHSCASSATVDGSKAEWVSVPVGLCDKLVGGSKEAPKS